jgi:hypothetical protein
MSGEEERYISRGEASNSRIINSNGQDLLRVWEVISAIVNRLREVGFEAQFECSLGAGHHLNEFESSKIPPGKHNQINIYIKVKIHDSFEDFHSTFHFVRENRYGGADGKFHSKSQLTPSIERAIFEYIPGTTDLVFLSLVPAQSGISKFTKNPTTADMLAEIRCRNAHHLIFQCVEAVLKEDNNARSFSDNVAHALTAVSNVGKIRGHVAAAAVGAGPAIIDTYRGVMDLGGLESPIIAASHQKVLAYQDAAKVNHKAMARRAELEVKAADEARSAAAQKSTSLEAMAARATGARAASEKVQILADAEKFKKDLKIQKPSIERLDELLEEYNTKSNKSYYDKAREKILCEHLKGELMMLKKFGKGVNVAAIDKKIEELKTKITGLSGGKRKTRRTKRAGTRKSRR